MASNHSKVIIAVMGMTGSGKSTYIKEITGREDVLVGHGLSSGTVFQLPTRVFMLTKEPTATEEVTSFPYHFAGTDFELVDTPGFDDSRHNDDVIADKLLAWLRDSLRAGRRLSGIIYIQRITDCRMKGRDLANLGMFRKLVGSRWFQNVILATSFWSDADPSEGARRESELCDRPEYWKRMTAKGSKVVRIGLDKNADRRLLLKIAENDKILLQAQKEMNEGKQNSETSAAQEVNSTLKDWERRFDYRFDAETEAARRELAEQQRQADERWRAQRQTHEQGLQAQRIARRQQEAEKAAEEHRQANDLREQQRRERQQEKRLEELQHALREEQGCVRELREAQQRRYAAYQCAQKLSGVRVICNQCKRKIKYKRDQFYRTYSLCSLNRNKQLTLQTAATAETKNWSSTTMISAIDADHSAKTRTTLR